MRTLLYVDWLSTRWLSTCVACGKGHSLLAHLHLGALVACGAGPQLDAVLVAAHVDCHASDVISALRELLTCTHGRPSSGACHQSRNSREQPCDVVSQAGCQQQALNGMLQTVSVAACRIINGTQPRDASINKWQQPDGWLHCHLPRMMYLHSSSLL